MDSINPRTAIQFQDPHSSLEMFVQFAPDSISLHSSNDGLRKDAVIVLGGQVPIGLVCAGHWNVHGVVLYTFACETCLK